MRWVVLVAAGVLGAGCAERCVNGETAACVCTDGRPGAQLCRSDGTFDPCLCTGPVPNAGGGAGGFGGGSFGGGTGGFGGGGFGGGGGALSTAPALVTPSPAHVVVGDPLVLSVVFDAGALPVSWRWSVRAPDGGAAALDDATRAQPLFNAADPGDYLVQVTATSDGGATQVSFPVRASTGRMLPGEPTAIAAHGPSDRLVFGRTSPFSVDVHDVASGRVDTVLLTRAPLALGFTPDGERLVVGQDSQVQVIDVTRTPPELVFTWPVTGVVRRLAAGPSQVVLQTEGNSLGTLRVSTGEQTTRFFGSQLGFLNLHPDEARLYAVEQNFSGSTIYRVNLDPLDGGIVSTVSRNFSGSGTSPCGDGWLSRDGLLLFTACGQLFRTAPVFANDLVHGGQVPTQRYLGLSETSDAGLVYGLAQARPTGGSQRLGTPLVLTIDRATLRQNSIAPLPDTSSVLGAQLEARFLFIDSRDRVHVVMVNGVGASTVKTFWLTRTGGEL